MIQNTQKRVALVHDYLNEFGGAERVLKVLSEMYPNAPIYTIFKKDRSPAAKEFEGKMILESWFSKIPYPHRLISPLRFLLPAIWNSFDFSDYDIVITSAAWAVTKGLKKSPSTSSGSSRPIEICYLHTPPRWLYGYDTSRDWSRGWFNKLVRVYAHVVGHFLRQYDFKQAQKTARNATQSVAGGVDHFIVNSKNVGKRVEKYYGRKDYTVIYPPIEIGSMKHVASSKGKSPNYQLPATSYFLAGGRMSASKNFDLIIKACEKANVKLKIYGTGALDSDLKKLAGKNVEFLGRVSDEELIKCYRDAKAFIVAQKDEDFGITPVEAAVAGTPSIAYKGGGLVESVVDGKTGLFFDELTVDNLSAAIKKFEKMKWDKRVIQKHAMKFSREEFEKKFRKEVASLI